MDSENSRRCKVRRTAQQIQQLVAQFHRGGQTIDQFARQQGVVVSTVKRWLRMPRQRKAPRLVEVNRAPNLGSSSRIGQLRLSHGLVLELEHGFPAEPIARLVQLLEGR
jgi:transposase-like protein